MEVELEQLIQQINDTRVQEKELAELLDKTSKALHFLNERIEDIDRHQFLYDIVGVGLTVLGVVLAVIAIIFILKMSGIAKFEAREAANKALEEYLHNPKNSESVIRSWMDDNASDIAQEVAFSMEALRASDEIGDKIAEAWNLPNRDKGADK